MSSITHEQVLQMSYDDIAKAIKDPQTSAQMQGLLRDRKVAAYVSGLMIQRKNELEAKEKELEADEATIPPTTEELAAQAAAAAATPVVPPTPETPVVPPPVPVADHAAEDAELKEQGITVSRDASGKITRLVQEYQVCDESGQPIGRPTSLVAYSIAELFKKQRIAHESSTRAYSRLKKQKTTFKQEPKTILTPEELKAAAAAALEEKNPAKVEDVITATIESRYQEREKSLQQREAEQAGREISNDFMRDHLHDYKPCEANRKAIGDYLTEHQMEFTRANLEAAFADLMDADKLVKVTPIFTSTSVAQTPNANANTAAEVVPAPAIPASAQPAAATQTVVAQPAAVSQPMVEATVSTSAAPANQAPAARRPGVNGSLPPGTSSATRTVQVDPAQTRKEFMQRLNKMTAEEMKKKRDTDPQFVKQLAAYGIKLK